MTAARLTGPQRALAVLLAVVLAAVVLRVGRPVLAPAAAGAFLAVLAQPIAARLERRLPGWLAVLLTVLVLLVGVGAFLGALGWSVRAVGAELLERRPALEAAATRVAERAAAFGIPVPRAGAREAGGATGGGVADAARSVATGLLSAAGGLLLALAVAALSLAERGELRRRFAAAVPGRAERPALDVVDESAAAFRRYFWVKSLTSVLTGTASGLLALAFGLPLAWVWGFLAFLLEYVPTVGSVIAVVPPSLMAAAEAAGGGGGGFGRAGLVFAAFAALQVTLGNIVDPRIEGRLMALSPLAVLLAIVLWGFLWGAVGALLAVPLTVGLVIACRRVRGAEGLAVLLAGQEHGDGGRQATGTATGGA